MSMNFNYRIKITICMIFLLKFVTCNQEDLLPSIPMTSPRKLLSPAPRRLEDTIFATPTSVPFAHSTCDDQWISFGGDARLIQALANNIGVKKCFKTEEDKNWTITDAILLLRFRVKDVIGLAIQLYPVRIEGLKYLYPHIRSDVCLLVNKIPAERWSIFHAYSDETWSAIGIMLVFFIVALFFWGQSSVVFHVWKTFISGSFPSNHGPKTRKALFLLLSVSGVILLSTFSGCITSIISVPKESVQINTLEEANARITELQGHMILDNFFKENGENDVAYSLFKKRIDPYREDVNYLKDEPTKAIIHVKDILELMKSTGPLDENRQPLTHLVNECLLSPAYRAFPVRDDWPYYEKFNDMLMRMRDSGISDWMYSHTLTDFRKAGMNIESTIELKSLGEPVILSVSAILEPLILLLAGWALASLAFALEVLWKQL